MPHSAPLESSVVMKAPPVPRAALFCAVMENNQEIQLSRRNSGLPMLGMVIRVLHTQTHAGFSGGNQQWREEKEENLTANRVQT